VVVGHLVGCHAGAQRTRGVQAVGVQVGDPQAADQAGAACIRQVAQRVRRPRARVVRPAAWALFRSKRGCWRCETGSFTTTSRALSLDTYKCEGSSRLVAFTDSVPPELGSNSCSPHAHLTKHDAVSPSSRHTWPRAHSKAGRPVLLSLTSAVVLDPAAPPPYAACAARPPAPRPPCAR
jgi:hypothetical protein